MADPIIIVDAQGNEHEFPPGMDPKKAAAIVRKATGAPEPKTSLSEKAMTPLLPQIKHAANAIADWLSQPRISDAELNEHIKGAGTLSAALRGGAAGIVQGAGDLASSYTSPLGLAFTLLGMGPESKAAELIPGAKALLKLPAVEKARALVHGVASGGVAAQGAYDLATKDTLGEKATALTQIAAGGAGLAGNTPAQVSANNILRIGGSTMEKVGSNPAFKGIVRGGAVGVAGGSAYTGHPVSAGIGAASTVIPEGMVKLGQKMQRMAGVPANTDALPSGARVLDYGDLKPSNIKVAPRPDAVTPNSRVPLSGTPAEASGRVQKIKAAEAAETAKLDAAQAKIDAEAAKVKAAEALKQGTTPKTKFSETVSGTTPEGVKKTAVTTYAPEAEEEAAAGGDPFAAELLKRGINPNRVVSSKPTPGAKSTAFSGVPESNPSQSASNAAMRETATPAMPFADRTPAERAIGQADLAERRLNQGASPTGTERRVGQDVMTLADAGSGHFRSGSGLPGSMTPTEMLPGAAPEDTPFTFEGAAEHRPGDLTPGLTADTPAPPSIDDALANRLAAAGNSMDIAPNKGGNGPLTHGKFSPNDMMELEDIVKNHPGIGLADASSLLKARRTLREGAYRTGAGMDSVAAAMADRER